MTAIVIGTRCFLAKLATLIWRRAVAGLVRKPTFLLRRCPPRRGPPHQQAAMATTAIAKTASKVPKVLLQRELSYFINKT